jgi:para-nitrobenzyl esterase
MRRLALILSLALLLASILAPALGEEPSTITLAQTLYGPVSGVVENGVSHFRGVPFAKPPVGELRWQAPENPEPWTQTLVCDSFAPASMQIMETYDWWGPEFYYDWIDATLPASEDCLYLNIVTPAISTEEKLPVFIWFHGGASVHGYSFEPEFEASKLAAKGVIVVTAAYRLGLWGYMATPELSESSPLGVSGNYGLLDQIQSIRWIKENIEAFGGDPDNITIGGQSAGASAVTQILTSPLSKGLVQRAIINSSFGALGGLRTQEAIYQSSANYLEQHGFSGLSVEELRALPTSAFMTPEMTRAEADGSGWGTYLDGYALTMSPRDFYLSEGALEGIDVLFGSNSGEGNGSFGVQEQETIMANAKNAYGDLFDKYNFAELYKGTDDLGATLESVRLRSERGAIQHLVIAQVLRKLNPDSSFYPYFFTHWPPQREAEVRWAWHSAELWYFFNSMRFVPEQRDWTALDLSIGDSLSSYWANFMRAGDPNGAGLPYWPEVTRDEAYFMNLGDTFVPQNRLYEGAKKADRDEFMYESVITSNRLESFFDN